MVDGGKLVGPDPEHPFAKDPLFWKQNAIIQELRFTAGPVVCDEWETDPRVDGEWADYLKRRGTKRFLAVPIFMEGQGKGYVGIRHIERGVQCSRQVDNDLGEY